MHFYQTRCGKAHSLKPGMLPQALWDALRLANRKILAGEYLFAEDDEKSSVIDAILGLREERFITRYGVPQDKKTRVIIQP